MKIIIAGDFAPRARLARQVREECFSEIFPQSLIERIKSADYSIVNLECPIADDTDKPIFKTGPNLKCSEHSTTAIKYAGFKGVTLANNHILDYGFKGIKKTLDECKKVGLDTVGAGLDLNDASRILYVEHGKNKMAIINCCEHEFSIATDTSAGANPLNVIQQYYKIKEARSNADNVLVITHGGHEHFNLPSPRMQETYRFFVDAGADAVINHHQHCYSGFELYEGKPIFYGLGNFAFDICPLKTKDKWNYGYMVELDLNSIKKFKIIPYIQYSKESNIQLLDEDAFKEDLLKINSIISNTQKLEVEIKKYYEASCYSVKSILEPIQNRWIHGAQNRNLLPSLVSKKWLVQVTNYINCESHKDKLQYFLSKKL
mgnify:CR=1 FL=1